MAARFCLALSASWTLAACGPPAVQPNPPELDSSAEGTPAELADAPAALPSRNVVFIAVDGVRWQEIFEGVDAELAEKAEMDETAIVSASELMPALHAFVESRGAAIGAPDHGVISASGPNHVSLPGYTEMFTGRNASSLCQDNGCSPELDPTLFDQVCDRTDDPNGVAVLSSWAPIARIASTTEDGCTVSTGQGSGNTRLRVKMSDPLTALLEAGNGVDPFPGSKDYRPDRFTAPLALEYLHTAQPRFMFIGLGDTDEYGHRKDYPRYLEALRSFDAFFAALLTTLEETGDYGAATTVFVTTDHGRSVRFHDHGKEPESARVWLIAGGRGIEARGFVDSPEPRFLRDIAPTMRVLLGLPADEHPDAGRPMSELL